ncbi:protein IQ-DOMAIN 31-like [Carica papaya]|uniref:protein IQ-DOMAIN 31-like n=1 Tax=Carica papaya TaxID=3649 RepID=UPI000B8CF26F|nr:protein IQ-DOMAIN 31-like [Carica papaya]
MGKSPGKWIKAVLFGKKSTKSNVSKGRERASNGKEVLIAAKAAETEVALDQSLAPNSVNSAADRSKSKSELENKNAASISDDAFSFPETKHTDLQESPSQDARSDPQKLLEERAATTVQAAFRGYLARRAFWALKGIIRLQALIRGHLVRRQAVATLSCAMGIVKLQALVRGRQVRHSDIGMEVQRKCGLRQSMEGKLVDSVGADVSLRFKKFFANDFVSKLLASHRHLESGQAAEAEISQAPLEMTETLDLSSIVEPVDESKPLVESENKDENSPKTNGELNHKEDMIGNENQKTSRKASVAAKQERAENGIQNSPTLPSYMQATESAKAKLRLQGSPRSAPQEGTEKNNVARRHSLPSSTNSKISSQSPRTQRVVHAAGKGGSKGERATLASRDGNAKVTQVEWRR